MLPMLKVKRLMLLMIPEVVLLMGMVLVQAIAPLIPKGACEQLAVAGTKNGDWDIYLLDVRSRISRNMTRSPVDETHPFWSSDGEHLGYTASSGTSDTGEVIVQMVKTGVSRHYRVASLEGDPPQFSADGQAIMVGGGNFPQRMIVQSTGTACTQPSASPPASSGQICATTADWEVPDHHPTLYTSSDGTVTQLIVLDQNGSRSVASHAGAIFSPNLSPDGRCVAYVAASRGERELYMVDLTSGTKHLLMNQPGDLNSPAWRMP